MKNTDGSVGIVPVSNTLRSRAFRERCNFSDSISCFDRPLETFCEVVFG